MTDYEKAMEKYYNKRAHSWTWTWHCDEKTEEQLLAFHDAIIEVAPSYYCYGIELTKEGKTHLQGYFWFESLIRGSRIMKHMFVHQIYLVTSGGSSKQNIDYCSKLKKDNEVFIEDGDQPAQGKRSDLADISELISLGKPLYKIHQDYPSQTMYHFRGMEQLSKSYGVTNYKTPKVHTLATIDLALQYFSEEYGVEPHEIYVYYNAHDPTPYHHEKYGIMRGVLRENEVMDFYKAGVRHYSSNHLLYQFKDLVFIPSVRAN